MLNKEVEKNVNQKPVMVFSFDFDEVLSCTKKISTELFGNAVTGKAVNMQVAKTKQGVKLK